jgi:DNA-binding CsgD family transcriptional regulator
LRMTRAAANKPKTSVTVPPERTDSAWGVALELGRDAVLRRSWSEAYKKLTQADRDGRLEPHDLELLAVAAHLVGKTKQSNELLARTHQAYLAAGDQQRAARSACWLAFRLLLAGEQAPSGGWIARAERIVARLKSECVEHGYLLLPVGVRAVFAGKVDAACSYFAKALQIAEKFGDTDLTTMARQGLGRALIRRGDITRGMSFLDEAMIAVTAGEVSPAVAGGVYCSVIEACGETFDLRRAQEWTNALEQWCASQPGVVPYEGHCQVRRAEILQFHGRWSAALEEAARACEQLSETAWQPASASAFYRRAELHRLRGEFAEAEHWYRRAAEWSGAPSPGLALLRLAQGKREAARVAILQVLEEVREPANRARALEAHIRIALQLSQLPEAWRSAQELAKIARRFRAPYLHAAAAQASGAVLLARGRPREALKKLRDSLKVWRDLKAPYEAARTRVLIGLAYRAQGNEEAAQIELATARGALEALGAAPDLDAANALLSSDGAAGPLSARELQVLALIATGKTNRAIAGELYISEKTVARHVSNIFVKLDLSSRAAATAYAYEKKLV